MARLKTRFGFWAKSEQQAEFERSQRNFLGTATNFVPFNV